MIHRFRTPIIDHQDWGDIQIQKRLPQLHDNMAGAGEEVSSGVRAISLSAREIARALEDL